MPEKSVASALNSLTPEVRQVFLTLSNTLDEGKQFPFDPKPLTPDDTITQLGLDPDAVKAAKQSLFNEDVAHDLQARLGTDADLPPEPVTMTDTLSAAYDAHTGDSQ